MSKKEDDKNMDAVMSAVHSFFVEDATVLSVMQRLEDHAGHNLNKSSSKYTDALRYWLEVSMDNALAMVIALQKMIDEVDKKNEQ